MNKEIIDRTELGIICDIVMGQSPEGTSYNEIGNGTPLINGPTEFTNKYPIKRQWTTKETKICKKNDILICVRGSSTGRMNISDDKYCIGRGVAAISAKNNLALTSYIYYLLDLEVNNILLKSVGSTFPNINSKELNKLNIILFTLKEQNKIVNILGIWDKSIELKEKLLQEKKKQKNGLMERLLSEKIRSSGFNKEWKTVKLGTVMKQRIEIGYNDLELLAITSAKGVVRRTEVNVTDNSSEDKSKYKRILPGDIGYNTMRMWQGVSGLSKYEGIVSPAYTILKPTEKVDSEFMSYLFKLPQVVNLFLRNSQGLVSDTLNLKYENFKGIKVTIPTEIEEQKQISNILKTADKEIDLMKKELETIKEQKKGLMQLLLTGIVRVKPIEKDKCEL